MTIGEKKTWEDWGLKLVSVSIGLPEAKTRPVDIPGADGVLDLTEALGTVRYGNRSLQLVFDVMAEPERWHSITSDASNYLHGQRLRVILDTDPGYYYIGRLSLSTEKIDYLANRITITGDVEPYKYELLSGLEEWLWDPFSFVSGIIREYKNLVVNGSLRLTIPGTRREVLATITASVAMEVEWKGKRYLLSAGANKLYDIYFTDGDNVLIFYGNGLISVDYRGGFL